MSAQARVGDKTKHLPLGASGTIMAGAARTFVNGKAAARVGDMVMCDEHGPQTIVSGSGTVTIEGSPAARVGDLISCGAVIIAGSDDTDVGG